MGEVTKKPNVLSSEECEKMIFLRCSRFADAHYFPGGASIEECKKYEAQYITGADSNAFFMLAFRHKHFTSHYRRKTVL